MKNNPNSNRQKSQDKNMKDSLKNVFMVMIFLVIASASALSAETITGHFVNASDSSIEIAGVNVSLFNSSDNFASNKEYVNSNLSNATGHFSLTVELPASQLVMFHYNDTNGEYQNTTQQVVMIDDTDKDLGDIALNSLISNKGTLEGYVNDTSGNPLSDVTIRINRSLPFTIKTNSSGWYHSEIIPQGTYTVNASKAGYNSSSFSGLVIVAGSINGTNFTLQNVSSVDNDGDGYDFATDCDDTNPDIWEYMVGYPDNDGDGYGNGSAVNVCSGSSLPSGYASNNSDCNDANAAIYPGAPDNQNNGIDNNCDGVPDDEYVPPSSSPSSSSPSSSPSSTPSPITSRPPVYVTEIDFEEQAFFEGIFNYMTVAQFTLNGVKGGFSVKSITSEYVKLKMSPNKEIVQIGEGSYKNVSIDDDDLPELRIEAKKILAGNQVTLRIETLSYVEEQKQQDKEEQESLKERVDQVKKGVVDVMSKTFKGGVSRVPSMYAGTTIILGITCSGLLSYLLFFRRGF